MIIPYVCVCIFFYIFIYIYVKFLGICYGLTKTYEKTLTDFKRKKYTLLSVNYFFYLQGETLVC